VPYRREVNTLDVGLALVLVVAVLGGLRVGFVARALTWIGLAAGALAASFTVPLVLGILEAERANIRFFAGVGILALTVAVCTSVFQSVGTRLRAGMGTSPLSRVDRALGGLAGAVMVVGLVWFLLPTAAGAPGALSEQVSTSRSVAWVETATPPPPAAAQDLRALLDSSRFPEVWDDLRRTTETGPPPEDILVDGAVVARATASTVHVESRGCGRRYDGSGVTVQPGLVVTNAHVVAGADEVHLQRPDGERVPATVVRFDPGRDLALLAADQLGQEPLALAEIALGAEGVSIGYPGGQSAPRVAPLRVDDRRVASGTDIYGEQTTEREVLFLSAQLRQGDSGSPVLDDQGRVGGIVFAISPDQDTSAYALDLAEIEELLAAPRVANDVGRCLD
jgi:S1-C subfamily serine protease